MSMGDLSTFYSLPQSLSSEVYSFPCRGRSHPLLGLHLSKKEREGREKEGIRKGERKQRRKEVRNKGTKERRKRNVISFSSNLLSPSPALDNH
jgi:hypothetical protein